MNEAPASTSSATASRVLRYALPFLVSAVLLGWVVSTIDLRAVLSHMTLGVASFFLPALAVFLVVSLAIDALCLVVVISNSRPFDDLWVAARMKAATYLLGTINYAVGAGGLTLLVRRRAGMTLAEAAGTVFVIGIFDLGSLIAFVMIGVALMGASTPGLQAGVIVMAGGLIVAGFAVLRAPVAMGPFDKIRGLAVFRDARTLPLSVLGKLGVLRAIFVGSFVLLAWATLEAFSIHIPPLTLIVNVSVLLLVSALPIAVAGLGTGQVVFVQIFQDWAAPEALLAASLTLSFGLIVTRCTIGLTMAREFTREAWDARNEEPA